MNLKPYYEMTFDSVYPMYIKKAVRKNRTKQEVDQIITWLTGYQQSDIDAYAKPIHLFKTFFKQAPSLNPNRHLIKGVICGLRVEEIEDELAQNIRYLDKLIDELAKGKSMDKILRTNI